VVLFIFNQALDTEMMVIRLKNDYKWGDVIF